GKSSWALRPSATSRPACSCSRRRLLASLPGSFGPRPARAAGTGKSTNRPFVSGRQDAAGYLGVGDSQQLERIVSMLVLSRKLDQVVDIITPQGEVLRVAVVQIRGNKVRLGFIAPEEFQIVRPEVKKRPMEVATS